MLTCTWKKKGLVANADLSDNPAVKYGKEAEKYLRALFELDFPEYQVEYSEFKMINNCKEDYIFATLDGNLTKIDTGRKGILEIKTSTINGPRQWDKWDNKIPEHYYAQCLHQLLATGFDFVILKAQLKYKKDNELYATIWHYRIERSSVVNDIEILRKAEIKFWECLTNDRIPNMILPSI